MPQNGQFFDKTGSLTLTKKRLFTEENWMILERMRTDDLLNAIQALSQLSYGPIILITWVLDICNNYLQVSLNAHKECHQTLHMEIQY